MRAFQLIGLFFLGATLSACGLGETAATASLQAKQAQQAQQQMQQLKQQVDAANAQNQQRLDDAIKDAE
jgi:cell division protein FtsB